MQRQRALQGRRATHTARSSSSSARRLPVPPLRYRPDSAPQQQGHQSRQHGTASQRRRALKGPCIINLVGRQVSSVAVPFQHNPNASLTHYMQHAAEHLANIPLGGGGKLLRVDSHHIDIIVPRLELFDVWLQPKASTTITVTPTHANISCGTWDCVLAGSHHVQQLKLNERFNLDVLITFTWDEGAEKHNPRILVNGCIEVQVDIPAPFSFMPQPVLEAGGNAAISGVLMALMPAFLDKLSQDYGRWAKQLPTTPLA